MDPAVQQARIDAIDWYHEFDFGNGLRSQPRQPDVESHRRIWQNIAQQLDAVDFTGRSVLDIGCWDGYWSLYAERRGARSVLASDDRTQNWSDGKGLLLARELSGSGVEVNQDLSIYDLTSLGRTFDIILCMGVYYHLVDPFYALAQVRHCCHANSQVFFEGEAERRTFPQTAAYNLRDSREPTFKPSISLLRELAGAAYLSLASEAWLTGPRRRPRWWWRLRMCGAALAGSRRRVMALAARLSDPSRVFLACSPFEGTNPRYYYKPPFGLHRYDDRFRD